MSATLATARIRDVVQMRAQTSATTASASRSSAAAWAAGKTSISCQKKRRSRWRRRCRTARSGELARGHPFVLLAGGGRTGHSVPRAVFTRRR